MVFCCVSECLDPGEVGMVEEIIDTKDHQKQEDAPSTESSVDNKYDVPSDELSKKSIDLTTENRAVIEEARDEPQPFDDVVPPSLQRMLPEENDVPPRVLKVRVPPGIESGTTMKIRVPDEDHRILAVTVPPNVSEFYASYIPRKTSAKEKNGISSVTASEVVSGSVPNQKFLLVNVPPGTAPGTLIHVSVPDEPGRLLAAEVPAGVSQFHVTYESRPPRQSPRGRLPMANAYVDKYATACDGFDF